MHLMIIVIPEVICTMVIDMDRRSAVSELIVLVMVSS